jgi:hypothetical protein
MKRHGFQLTEILLATLLVTGPLLAIFQLVRSNTRHVAHLQEFVEAELMLGDVVEVLSSKSREAALQMASTGLGAILDQVAADRVTRVRRALSDGQLVLEPVNGSLELLALTITARVDGARLKIQRLIRAEPEERD